MPRPLAENIGEPRPFREQCEERLWGQGTQVTIGAAAPHGLVADGTGGAFVLWRGLPLLEISPELTLGFYLRHISPTGVAEWSGSQTVLVGRQFFPLFGVLSEGRWSRRLHSSLD